MESDNWGIKRNMQIGNLISNENIVNYAISLGIGLLTNSMAYGTRMINVAFAKDLQ